MKKPTPNPKKQDKAIQQIDQKEYCALMAAQLTQDILKLVAEDGVMMGPTFELDFIKLFMASFVANTCHRALTRGHAAPRPSEAAFQDHKTDFSKYKNTIQDAVASGFKGAMEAHTKQPVDYYCTVMAAQPTNKVVC